MSDVVLTKTRIRAGMWEGVLSGATAEPRIEVLHLEAPLPGVSLTERSDQPGTWALRVPIPAALLSDGVQTFLIHDAETGARLDHFTIITGVGMEDDVRAELDLLRAELDMLKKAFRRHCLEVMR